MATSNHPVTPRVELAGTRVPAIGQGTWHMGDRRDRQDDEVAVLRRGLELGMTLIDTAELYGSGASEELIGQALHGGGRRDQAFLVSKVLPSNASAEGVVAACERSLRRLQTDRLDLYLLHWKGPHPLEQTIEGFELLVQQGKIRAWGVSNFDADDLRHLPARSEPATDQVLYNLNQRWPESGLFDELDRRGIPVMAYSPADQGRLAGSVALDLVATKHQATPVQIALAWTIRSGSVIAIPQTSSLQHVEHNAAAATVVLDDDDVAVLSEDFPVPRRPAPMQIY